MGGVGPQQLNYGLSVAKYQKCKQPASVLCTVCLVVVPPV